MYACLPEAIPPPKAMARLRYVKVAYSTNYTGPSTIEKYRTSVGMTYLTRQKKSEWKIHQMWLV